MMLNKLRTFNLIVLISLFLVSCKFEVPELIQLEDLKLAKFSKNIIEIQLKAKVKNPNNYKVSIVNSDLDIFINGENMGKINLKNKVHFNKNSTESYTLNLVNKPENFLKIGALSLMSAIGKGKLQINIKGEVKGRAKMVTKKFNVDLNETLNMSSGINVGG